MPTYRKLSLEELNEMEKEFIDFLVLNGITGDDWVKLKVTNPEKAEGICDAFSDVVFTKILKNIRYIERHAAKQIVTIYCDDNQMSLLGLDVPDDIDIDLTNPEQFKTLKSNPPKGLRTLKSSKQYSKPRETELWDMLNDGFFVSDQKLYMALFVDEQ